MAMEYEEFVGRVEGRIGGAAPGEAEQAVISTFETLAERVSDGEARDIAEQLPEELAEPLRGLTGDPESFSLEEFFRRVAEKGHVDQDRAAAHVTVVMSVLGEAITEGELRDVRAQLPREFHPLLQG